MLNDIVGQFIESQNMKLCYQFWEENTETLIAVSYTHLTLPTILRV